MTFLERLGGVTKVYDNIICRDIYFGIITRERKIYIFNNETVQKEIRKAYFPRITSEIHDIFHRAIIDLTTSTLCRECFDSEENVSTIEHVYPLAIFPGLDLISKMYVIKPTYFTSEIDGTTDCIEWGYLKASEIDYTNESDGQTYSKQVNTLRIDNELTKELHSSTITIPNNLTSSELVILDDTKWLINRDVLFNHDYIIYSINNDTPIFPIISKWYTTTTDDFIQIEKEQSMKLEKHFRFGLLYYTLKPHDSIITYSENTIEFEGFYDSSTAKLRRIGTKLSDHFLYFLVYVCKINHINLLLSL